MADLNRYKSRNPLPIIILFVVFFILTPLFTLTDKGVMDKIVGLKLMLYQTVLSTYSPHCDNVSIPKVQVMITYLYDKDGNYVPGTNGMPVNIANSKEARNPTWEQLVWFLKCDNTDKQKYVDNIFNCMDYAVMLQNNATKAGWITAFVGISLRDNGTDNVSGHAINAFQTIDYGKVYIDCTRSAGETAYDIDKLVTVDIGKPYEATYIFPSKYYPMFLHYNSNQTVQTIRLEQWPLTQW